MSYTCICPTDSVARRLLHSSLPTYLAGVLSNDEDLEAYFHEYLVSPVLSRALHSADDTHDGSQDSR